MTDPIYIAQHWFPDSVPVPYELNAGAGRGLLYLNPKLSRVELQRLLLTYRLDGYKLTEVDLIRYCHSKRLEPNAKSIFHKDEQILIMLGTGDDVAPAMCEYSILHRDPNPDYDLVPITCHRITPTETTTRTYHLNLLADIGNLEYALYQKFSPDAVDIDCWVARIGYRTADGQMEDAPSVLTLEFLAAHQICVEYRKIAEILPPPASELILTEPILACLAEMAALRVWLGRPNDDQARQIEQLNRRLLELLWA